MNLTTASPVVGAVRAGLRRAPIVAAVALAVAGCGNSQPNLDEAVTAPNSSTRSVVETAAAVDHDDLAAAAPETSTTTSPPATEAPFADGFRLPEDFVAPTSSTSAPAPTTGAPVPAPTVPAVRADPASLYQGVLGNLGLDERVSPPVADPPTARPGTAPLTGLPSSPIDRAPIVVKIDNSAKARPQTGINNADLVIEEEVEWGITRLAAVFHSRGGDVGPVRSGRTTDISYLSGLGSPVLAYSGANDVTEALLQRQQRVQNLGANRFGGYWRSSDRSAPHNLYTATDQLWAAAAPAAAPPQFAYRADGVSAPGQPATHATVQFPSLTVNWRWNGQAWERAQAGSAHVTASGEQLTAANVVVVEVAEIPTGLKDSAGGVVPEYVFVGTGPATVLSDGHVVAGVWTRPSLADVATLTRPDGRVIELTPGVTWIEIVTTGALSVG